MKIVFRVDASAPMGIGHLMRCLTLAEALRARGAQIRFVSREHTGNLIALLQQKAMPVTSLPAPAINDTASAEDYAAWLGVTQAEDAEQSIEALNGEKPDWLVVDHYGLDIEWEQRLRPHVRKLMVIDDLANRHHDCDVLLDQNYSVDGEQRYAGLVPDACMLLVGPRYALLRPEYAAYRKTRPFRDGQVRKILVFMGGSDPHNMTGMTLEALSHPDLKFVEVDVVVGANNPHRKSIEQQVLNRPHTVLHEPRPHLADLMSQADLAIGAGGATSWERMCMGLPAVVVSIAQNQLPATEALKNAQLIHYAGHYSSIKPNQLTELLQNLCSDTAALTKLGIRNQLQVDGLGALRLAEVLHPGDTKEIRLRPAYENDALLYYSWLNSGSESRNSIEPRLTSWENFQTWFNSILKDSNSPMFVFEIAGLPLGQIRFENKIDEANIEYTLDRIIQGRDWDHQLVRLGMLLKQQIEPFKLRAQANKTSNSVFMRKDNFSILGSAATKISFAIAILSDQSSWLNDYLCQLLLEWMDEGHRVLWVHDKEALRPGDFCFYLSCGQIIPDHILSQYRHNLVVHESDLPRGKGWSPLTWQILEGKNQIPVTLFEAAGKVDSGVIYSQEWLEFKGHELIDELRAAQARATINLCKQFIAGYPQIIDEAQAQAGVESFYPRRRPDDSRLDPLRSIESQFELFRVVDNMQYPAFFDSRSHRYTLKIQKVEDL